MLDQMLMKTIVEERSGFQLSSSGWFVGKCQLCNDYKIRAGFKVDGQSIRYNCWNCHAAAGYEEGTGRISTKFRQVLTSLGIEAADINEVVASTLFKQSSETSIITLKTLTDASTFTATTQLPPGIFPLGHSEHKQLQEPLLDYLSGRCVDPLIAGLMFSTDSKLINRVIIPFYRGTRLIYWQARSILPNEKVRYLNAPVSREAVMYNMDALNTFSTAPLFVTEGIFDSLMVDGLALLGSQLNEAKTTLLAKSGRKLVFVLDKDRNGSKLGLEALSHNWGVATSPEGTVDLNDSVIRYGKVWTIHKLMKSVTFDKDRGHLLINYCRSNN